MVTMTTREIEIEKLIFHGFCRNLRSHGDRLRQSVNRELRFGTHAILGSMSELLWDSQAKAILVSSTQKSGFW